MRRTILNEVLDVLLEHRLVASESEFSRDWLGRSDSYMRGLRFHDALPSIGAIAICASKLQHYGYRLADAGRYEALAERFIELSDACHRQINARCEAAWLGELEKGPASKRAPRAV
ncbi:hypothetical protein SAMN05660686_02409 [Thalassobaculum litoreum DSM 18839]|uniref:Uncharacterized protein n=1 Tax=Thalassobaculum litoreum DSM 18839 TaxID=1123362 RepID=A0A8G2BK01_9PROT|nr:hypothetical protein SAMN05660686_02409 [Thalassobaculum litoreum DSM 18839]